MAKKKFHIYFSDFFEVEPDQITSYGAFNISLINDLPLFIDPFLLFNSEKADYQELHKNIVEYVRFLKAQSPKKLPTGLLESWFYFPEIKENWLGYSKVGNSGRGLGRKFADALKINLCTVFQDFGDEVRTGTHLEKLTLVKNGVGKDQISDFTCNLIVGYLAKYTEVFSKAHINQNKLARFTIPKVEFNYKTQTWMARQFLLPRYGKQFVLLSPVDMLTKDEAWISHKEFVEDFTSILSSVPNTQLRGQIDNYFAEILPTEPRREEVEVAIEKVIRKYPSILDHYIALKEKSAAGATRSSAEKVGQASRLFVDHLQRLINLLDTTTDFYETGHSSYQEAMTRVTFLKHVIEAQDGYRVFYLSGKPIRREQDLQIMFKLTWFASDFDSNAEVNNGRGPADFSVSYGSRDKVIVEFKLASNSQLERNILKQAEIYADASRATHPPIKVILYFSVAERDRVKGLLAKHDLDKCEDIVLIDATPEKSSASKA